MSYSKRSLEGDFFGLFPMGWVVLELNLKKPSIFLK